jgi:hypothetical protein
MHTTVFCSILDFVVACCWSLLGQASLSNYWQASLRQQIVHFNPNYYKIKEKPLCKPCLDSAGKPTSRTPCIKYDTQKIEVLTNRMCCHTLLQAFLLHRNQCYSSLVFQYLVALYMVMDKDLGRTEKRNSNSSII